LSQATPEPQTSRVWVATKIDGSIIIPRNIVPIGTVRPK